MREFMLGRWCLVSIAAVALVACSSITKVDRGIASSASYFLMCFETGINPEAGYQIFFRRENVEGKSKVTANVFYKGRGVATPFNCSSAGGTLVCIPGPASKPFRYQIDARMTAQGSVDELKLRDTSSGGKVLSDTFTCCDWNTGF
jgi:hypothetical protein